MRAWKLFIVATLALFGSGAAVARETPGKAFQDCTNCPDMMPIKPGSFDMGITVEKEQQLRKQSAVKVGRTAPVHKVTFARGFAMGMHPVTVAQFRTFVEETGYRTSDSCYNQHKIDGHFVYENVKGATWRDPGFNQGDNYPAVCVSGIDGDAYAAWLSKKTGHSYALPTEAQYEYSLRGGTTTLYFWGDDRDKLACQYSNQPDLDQAASLGNAPSGPEYRFQCHDGYAATSPVGTYKPNPFGLYDMAGNIWEWTADCWNGSYEGAPTDGSAWKTGDCDARPYRGGSYGNAAFAGYAAFRAPRDAAFNGQSWGFRVVRND